MLLKENLVSENYKSDEIQEFRKGKNSSCFDFEVIYKQVNESNFP